MQRTLHGTMQGGFYDVQNFSSTSNLARDDYLKMRSVDKKKHKIMLTSQPSMRIYMLCDGGYLIGKTTPLNLKFLHVARRPFQCCMTIRFTLRLPFD